jgi:hypothetical protein
MAGGGIIPANIKNMSSNIDTPLWKGNSTGEIIPHKNFTYHSIGELEPLILEH